MRLIDGDKLVSIFAQRKEVWRGHENGGRTIK